MSWACEMLALAGVAADFPGRGLRLDFETLLENPADQLVRCLEHLYGGRMPMSPPWWRART